MHCWGTGQQPVWKRTHMFRGETGVWICTKEDNFFLRLVRAVHVPARCASGTHARLVLPCGVRFFHLVDHFCCSFYQSSLRIPTKLIVGNWRRHGILSERMKIIQFHGHLIGQKSIRKLKKYSNGRKIQNFKSPLNDQIE